MIAAKKQDKANVIGILSTAFNENKSVDYILGKGQRKTRIKHLMAYAFDVCWHYGKVLLSDDGHACALVLLPDRRKNSLRSIWFDVQLIWNCIGMGHMRKAVQREKKIKALQAVEDDQVYYLWFIGVDPKYQHQGTGSRLLEEIITDSRQMGRTVLLETSTETNLPWYQKNGFTIYSQFNFGYALYFLKQ